MEDEITCQEVWRLMFAYNPDDAPGPVRKAVLGHFKTCQSCSDRCELRAQAVLAMFKNKAVTRLGGDPTKGLHS